MHLIRLDIDRKNSTAHLQAGPFGGGLNAIYAPMHGGGATMSRFVRSILFRGNYVNEVFETEEGKEILKKASLEGEYLGIGNLVIGYADQQPKAAPRKAGRAFFIK